MALEIGSDRGHVIIAGFGVGGRFIAEYLTAHSIPFIVVEMNPETCEVQRGLGLNIMHGDISEESVLREAGVETAEVLALAIPNEDAAVKATEIANAIHPEIHIIASTRYTSTGLQALQAGADDVIVAEQAVAQEFYRRIAAFMSASEARLERGAGVRAASGRWVDP